MSSFSPQPYLAYRLQCPNLPLAVYREIAAHLQQVAGVETGLTGQTADHFDYRQSQVEGLWLRHAANLEPQDQHRLRQILDYYSERFGPWISSNNVQSNPANAADA